MARIWMYVSLLMFIAIKTQGCPQGWVQGPNACFFFSKFGGSWADGNAICQGFNTRLAEPEDDATLAFLLRHAKIEHPTNAQFYLGGSDMFAEGTWVWSSTLDKVNPSHWTPGNPNDDYNNGDCLTLNAPGGGLNDVRCTDTYSFICQAETENHETVNVIG
ncbi:perlucin-like [Argopecten irradians]|uniref:perlucin-like n=1 Tax=Argopecten irradians TaxID=31199 RepID=UPI003713F06D